MGCKMMTKYYRDEKQACGVGGLDGIAVKRKKNMVGGWIVIVCRSAFHCVTRKVVSC